MAPLADPPHKRVSSSGVTAPAMPPKQTRPFGTTLYATIDLKIKDKFAPIAPTKMTAIFMPKGFTADTAVDILLYLHGMKKDDPHIDIKKYFAQSYGGLREKITESGRNIVLLAPTLGYHSEANGLLKAGGLDGFLQLSLAAIRDHTKSPELSLRNLIFSCHSAGGEPMRRLATASPDEAQANLQECWGFDCNYNPPEEIDWPKWAHERTADRAIFYFRPKDGTSSSVHAVNLRKLKIPNLIVKQSKTMNHMLVPVTHLGERLAEAKFLRNVAR